MSFELQPELRGELLRLRPLRPTDLEALYAVASDPLIWAQHPRPDRWQRPVFEEFFQQALAARSLAIECARTGEVLGSSRYYDPDPAAGRVCVGFTFLARKCWGQGHNRELKALMLPHAFASFATV